jgi:glycosyltransferase involved in cell wall biosynthesis
VNRLLAEPSLAARLGQSARQLAVQRYAWSGAAKALESFYREILGESSKQLRLESELRGSASVA